MRQMQWKSNLAYDRMETLAEFKETRIHTRVILFFQTLQSGNNNFYNFRGMRVILVSTAFSLAWFHIFIFFIFFLDFSPAGHNIPINHHRKTTWIVK